MSLEPSTLQTGFVSATGCTASLQTGLHHSIYTVDSTRGKPKHSASFQTSIGSDKITVRYILPSLNVQHLRDLLSLPYQSSHDIKFDLHFQRS